MGMYRVAGKQTTIAATKTALTLISAATCRPRLCDLRVTTSGAPGTDAQTSARVSRFTAAGTSAASAPTPAPMDNGDPASLATAGWDHSAEPTYTTDLMAWSFNPRSVIQWAAYDPRSEILLPATAANGIGMQTVGIGGATGNLLCEFGFYDK